MVGKVHFCRILFTYLLDSLRGGEHPLVGVVEDDVDGLVEALEGPNEVAAVRGDDGDLAVHEALERGGHLDCKRTKQLERKRSLSQARAMETTCI